MAVAIPSEAISSPLYQIHPRGITEEISAEDCVGWLPMDISLTEEADRGLLWGSLQRAE